MPSFKQDFGFKDIIDSAADGVIVTQADQIDAPGPTIVYVNDAMARLSGYAADELLGQTPRLLQGEKTSVTTKILIRQHLEKKQPLRCRILNYRKDGSTYWVELSLMPLTAATGEVTHFASIQRDITSYKKVEDLLLDLPNLDAETQLLSAGALQEALEKEWRRSFRHHSVYTLLMFEVSESSERLNHLDSASLSFLGALCRDLVRKEDSVGRLAGNEFCVLMPETGEHHAKRVQSRLQTLFETRLQAQPNLLARGLGVKSVISEMTLLDEDASAALRRARQALKSNG